MRLELVEGARMKVCGVCPSERGGNLKRETN